MQFACPSCQSTITANPNRPGKFTPKCPKCGTAFVLSIQILSLDDYKASQATKGDSRRVELDPDSTFASAASRSAIGADSTFSSRAADSPGDPDSTFATQPSSPNRDPDRTEFADGRPKVDDDLDRTAATNADGPSKKSAVQKSMPGRFGGYEVLKPLGQGGMGAVYLCRQLSLDRSVAVKVMNEEWASDATFVARFMREAYAAAQLTHHNVVQVYELGQEAKVNYFSMEFVDGRSLGELLKKKGKLPASEAVGYVIQAARGLKFAHDRGMVHRDIKPDNLMLNSEGLVKVADLGLVKTRSMNHADDATAPDAPANERTASGSGNRSGLGSVADVTRVGSTMGSPYYMAPEQCRDATSVDGRADVYSLGCTLYAFLAGRAPFTGTTAVELISKHLSEPPPPLQKVATDVPKELAVIVDRTLAKDPGARYQSMDDLIGELKDWQDRQASGPPRATEEQLAGYEGLTKQLANSPKAKLAGLVGTFGPMVGLLVALLLLPFNPAGFGAMILATVAAVLTGFVATGLLTRSFVFDKVREWAFGAKWTDWLTVAIALVFFAIGLFFSGLLLLGLVAIVLGAGVGIGYAYVLAKPAHDARMDAKDELEKITKRLRLQGMDEDAVRKFAIENAGDRWEIAFETLYGYPAKVQARSLYSELVARKPKYAGWRDGLVTKFDAMIEGRKQARAKKLLQKMEAARLKAEGVGEAEAKARAEGAAEEFVEQAKELKSANVQKKATVNVGAMMTRYEKARASVRPRKNPLVVLFGKLLRMPFDPRLRLLAGALLIVGAVMWIQQNSDVWLQIQQQSGQVKENDDVGKIATSAWQKLQPLVLNPEKTKPLKLEFLPDSMAGWFRSINPLVAGVLLLLSALSSRTGSVLAIVFGAVVAFAGHMVLELSGVAIPDLGPLKPVQLTAIAGFAIGVLGFFLLGRK